MYISIIYVRTHRHNISNLCMYICIYVIIFILYICITGASRCIYVYIYVYIYMYMYIYITGASRSEAIGVVAQTVGQWWYAPHCCRHVLYLSNYVYLYLYINIYTYIHTRTHTHTHTHTVSDRPFVNVVRAPLQSAVRFSH